MECWAARLRLLQLRTREYVVKGLCFSADMDVMWPKLSRKLRTYFISRVKGKELEMGASERQELSTFFSADLPHLRTISSHLVLLALSIGKLSQRRLSANPSQGVQFNFQTPEPDDDDEADTIGNSSALQHALNRFGELFLGLLMGDSQLPRNLASSTRSYNVAWRWAVVRMFLFAASGFRKVVWRATQRLLWEGNETLSALRRTANRQTKRVITKDYIQIHSPLRPETAFLYSQDPQKLVYNHYKGILPKQPLSRKQMIAITEYDIDYTLKRKEVWKNLEVREKIVFTYAPVTKKLREVPLKKDIYDKNGTHHSTYYYAKGDGRVTHAHFNRDGLLFNASYIYWSPESFEILEIHYLVPQLSLIVKLHFYTITHDKIPTSTLQRIVCEKLRPTDPVHHPRHHTAIAHLEMPELTARPTDAWWTTTTFKLDALARRVPTTLLQSKTETVAMVTPRLLVEMERMGLLGYPDEEMLHFHVENPFFFHRRGERKWWGDRM
ncbi:hypothetical protein BC829DRAFT_280830 [Chytridium lagenaria]|nr:hypothetical protein BC829DRAFT_280830 [Chytridium lagenaria]